MSDPILTIKRMRDDKEHSVQSHLTRPSQPPAPARPCGHPRHVGTCPACQRIQLERWSRQLAAAQRSRRVA